MAEMFRLIDTDIEVKDIPGAPALIVRTPMVVFDNVTFGYDPGRTILDRLSFEVPAGSTTAIVGPSGAGKSTIGRLLFRFYDPIHGRVLVDGEDIARVRQDSLRARDPGSFRRIRCCSMKAWPTTSPTAPKTRTRR